MIAPCLVEILRRDDPLLLGETPEPLVPSGRLVCGRARRLRFGRRGSPLFLSTAAHEPGTGLLQRFDLGACALPPRGLVLTEEPYEGAGCARRSGTAMSGTRKIMAAMTMLPIKLRVIGKYRSENASPA